MSRIKLLPAHEIREFDTPTIFSVSQQSHFFNISDDLEMELDKLRHPCSKMGMLLQWGYFKFHGRFYEVSDFKDMDILFVAKQLNLNLKYLDFHRFYTNHLAFQHKERILSIIHWKPFDQELFKHQVERLVESQLVPRKALWETRAYLFRQGIESPAYDKYLKTINEALLVVSKRINLSLEKYLTASHRHALDEFLVKKVAYQKSEIQKFKVIIHPNTPKEIKKNVQLFEVLRERLEKVGTLVEKLNLSDATIDYHAHWVTIADNDKIETNVDKYLFLLCFLVRQVRQRQDYFIDIIQNSVKSAENRAKMAQKEEYFHKQKERKQVTQLLIDSRISYKQQVEEVKIILKSLQDNDTKISQIEGIFEVDDSLTDVQLALIESLSVETGRDEKTEFYRLWQRQSIWLSNRVSQPILKLIINQEETDKTLFEAVGHYIEKKGKITKPTKNLKWLDDKQQDALYEINEKGEEVFQRRLYKMFFFEAINDGIKSGKLNFNHSYRFRFLEEYLFSKKEWKDHKEQLLTDAELTHLTDYEDNIGVLKENLDQLYHQVNDGYNLGLNPHLRFDKANKPIIATPAVEKPDLSKISSYFNPARFTSILDLLADVEKTAPFLHHLGHQSKTHERKRPTSETFFASIIALGCNIGVEKMRDISKGIQVSTLQNTSDWYLSLQALKDANDAIIKMKNGLYLPEIHRNDPNELHTASDGQKILNKKNSLNAAFSYKYPGFDKASVANTAVDERFAMFYSTVIVASAREAVSMVDMHLNNPVIKSTIHSTDTHGSTEVVFGMMHLLGVFFAPRIKDLGSQQLYGFKSKKEYAELDYKLIPDHTINTALIEKYWDDILRVMTSLKLGKTTAEQVLKRLNSYSQQNPLQRAMKEFGKIIKSSFILKYYDDLALRQSIEKMLSHIELMNRFAKAVFFSNNQEFQVATKEEQEKIIQCRLLLQNAIVLWNYMYLSEMLTKVQSQEELEEIMAVIRNSTAVVWHHVNMMGEYDFTKLLNKNNLRFDIDKIRAWKYKNVA
jgi:TnpA family transposase